MLTQCLPFRNLFPSPSFLNDSCPSLRCVTAAQEHPTIVRSDSDSKSRKLNHLMVLDGSLNMTLKNLVTEQGSVLIS